MKEMDVVWTQTWLRLSSYTLTQLLTSGYAAKIDLAGITSFSTLRTRNLEAIVNFLRLVLYDTPVYPASIHRSHFLNDPLQAGTVYAAPSMFCPTCEETGGVMTA